ncbi:MAG: hypothetical protein P8186_23325 [Anaerolineae bacterium]
MAEMAVSVATSDVGDSGDAEVVGGRALEDGVSIHPTDTLADMSKQATLIIGW